jgi:hypothetical protein
VSETSVEPPEPLARPPLSFYEVLGVPRGATPDLLDTARRVLLAELEARGGDEDRRLDIENAHRVLSDPLQRAAYDRMKGYDGAPAAIGAVPRQSRGISPWRTVTEAWRMVTSYPRDTMLPMLAVQMPVALLSSIVVAVLYLTAFNEHEVRTIDDLLDEGPSGPLFVLIVSAAIQALFTQVARGATIVSIAGVMAGSRRTLSAALDPAFTRMGGLILLTLTLATAGFALAVTLVGLVLLPYLVVRTCLSFEAYMLENVTPLGAIARSWQVMRGNILRLLGALALGFLFSLSPVAVITSFGAVGGGSRTQDVLIGGAISFAQALALVPLLAFFTAMTTIFYLHAKAGEDERTAPGV